MLFELRQCVIRPGQQKAWVKCMEEEIIPFQVKMGMVILGSFVGEMDGCHILVGLARHPDAESRRRPTRPVVALGAPPEFAARLAPGRHLVVAFVGVDNDVRGGAMGVPGDKHSAGVLPPERVSGRMTGSASTSWCASP